MPGSRRFVARQEMRYFVTYEIWANSAAEATRIARGEEMGRTTIGRSRPRPHHRPTVEEKAR